VCSESKLFYVAVKGTLNSPNNCTAKARMGGKCKTMSLLCAGPKGEGPSVVEWLFEAVDFADQGLSYGVSFVAM
jgi:hypothetical protein